MHAAKVRRRVLALLVMVGGVAIVWIVWGGYGHADSGATATGMLIEDFEEVTDWDGLRLETDLVRNGRGSGRWDDHRTQPSIKKVFTEPLDVSSMDHVQLWIYSGVANGAQIESIFDSNNEADPAGLDYYRYRIYVDWTGWRFFSIPQSSFAVARNPLGWHHIDSVRFSTDGWGHEPLEDTLLIFDDLSWQSDVIDRTRSTAAYVGADFVYTYTLVLAERTGATQVLTVGVQTQTGYPFDVEVLTPHVTLPASGMAQALVRITVPAATIVPEAQLAAYPVACLVANEDGPVDGVSLDAAVPLPSRSRPRLLVDVEDFARIATWTEAHGWAEQARTEILRAADEWPTVFEETFHLEGWQLPPEGGQWSLWYICPDHGVQLQYEGPDRHVCPVDGRVYDGWPYDQVIYAWMHDDLADAALNLALAFRLTGEQEYAESAAKILLAYADAYLGYPYHDKHDLPSSTGGRVHAQTLNEAIWLISMAWAYDLVADTPALTAADGMHIEQELLREAVVTIKRHRFETSNWQSWHNAGIGAVGFALEDPAIIARAIQDPINGFEHQMEAGVSAEGFWHEGSWSYHFYALKAHRYLAEMAERAGLNLYANPALWRMFNAPLLFAQPDWILPPFNDSGSVSLVDTDILYESAYRRYGSPLFAAVLNQRARGPDALFWGAETVPDQRTLKQNSTFFPDAGYAVLRVNEGDQPVYLALDYGPHGGGHGHFDKLGFVLHAQGVTMGVDPGTQSYAASTHETWYRQTVAHNTVVVDGEPQDEATGALHRFAALPGVALVAADAGDAYGANDLLRTLIVSTDYVLDRFRVRATDGQAHNLDWVYHNFGTLVTTLPLTPYAGFPSKNGYQHLDNPQAVVTDSDWQATFEMKETGGGDYGSVLTSQPTISATFTYNGDEAASGNGSGQLTYDFSAATGSVVYQTEPLEPIAEVPGELRLALYGDGAGHDLTLRVYDSTYERFVYDYGRIDWTGWRAITAADVISWRHYRGDDDGIFDLPAKYVAIQVDSEQGGAPAGVLYVDDIILAYPTAGEQVVENFDLDRLGLRMWMLGAPGTTAVVGEGLGPDVAEPVPFAMARRQAYTTTFATLLEPFTRTAVITTFNALITNAPEEDEATAFELRAPDFFDRLLAVADGPAGVRRTFGDAACDGVLCLIRRTSTGSPLRLVLVGGGRLEDASRLLISTTTSLEGVQIDYEAEKGQLHIFTEGGFRGPVWIWGPAVTRVWVNGTLRTFRREVDYVVLAADRLMYVPLVLRKFER